MLSSTTVLDQPDDEEALLLKVILTDQPSRIADWQRWSKGVDFEHLTPVVQDLLPSLYKAVSPLVSDQPLLNRMRGVYKRTWTHNLNALRIAASCCQTLARADVDAMLFKGVSLLADYNDPGLRPMSDVDILVPRSHADTAIKVLLDEGWRPFPSCGRSHLQHVIVRRLHGWSFLKHGVNVDLHWQTLHATLGRVDDVSIWEHHCEETLFGIPVAIPSPSDRLLYALAHGADNEGRRRVTWALDAAQLVGKYSNDIDWAGFRAKASRMVLDVLVRDLLLILRERFDIPVSDMAIPTPGKVRGRLFQLALHAPDTARPTAYLGHVIAASYLACARMRGRGSIINWMAHLLRPSARSRPQAFSFTTLSRAAAHSETAWQFLYRFYRRSLRPTPVPWEAPELPMGRVIRFGKGGSGLEFTAGGWAQPEAEWTWTDGRQARLIFTTRRVPGTPLRLRLAATPYLPVGCGNARFRFTLNGEDQGPISFDRANADTGVTFFLLPEIVRNSRHVEVVIHCFSAGRPSDDGADSDARLLGIRLSSILLEDVPRIGAAFEAGFAIGEVGTAWLGQCWWQPEPTGTWSANRTTTLLVPLIEAPGEQGLSQRLHVELSPAPGAIGPGDLEVLVSGSAFGRCKFHLVDARRQWFELEIIIAEEPPRTPHLMVRLSVDRLVIPSQHGSSTDGRSLGIQLHRMAVSKSDRGKLPVPA